MSTEKLPLLQETDVINLSYLKYGSSGEGNDESHVKIVPYEERITYTWSDLNVFASKKVKGQGIRSKLGCYGAKGSDLETRKHILKNVCGVAYPGELLAILGSSGSGKTTLLNALTFRSCSNVIVTGLRCANKIPLTSTSLVSKSAYVQQDDLFFGTFTVKEHLTFQALLRMDKSISTRERMLRVEEVLSELSLNKCENTQIGNIGEAVGISGGERKRLSFASEVLTNPSVMVCDEPTSGLDSFMALNVVQTLKNLAKSGKTVVCTIHQPSSELYAMFDKILLMAEGKVAFLGTPEEAILFFNSLKAPCPRNFNPADFYIQLLAVIPEIEESCKQAITMVCNNFEKTEYSSRIRQEQAFMSKIETSYNDFWLGTEMNRSPYKASLCTQFRVVLWRSILTTLKEPKLIKVRLFQTSLVALLIGLIYRGQNLDQNGVINMNGVLFTFLTSMTFQNVFAVVHVFCGELPIFLREHKNGMYRPSVYFICKTLAETPLFIFLPLLFVSICYFMIGLNAEDGRFFITAGILVLITNVSTSFGYLISCVSTNISMALSVGPPIIVPLLLFGGYFLNVNSIPIYFHWLSWISWFRFGYEALLVNQWAGVNNITCTVPDLSECPKDGDVVLRIFNFKQEHLMFDIFMLVGLIIAFRFMAYLVLLLKIKSRQYFS